MNRDYLKGSWWDWAFVVECETCGWYNISQDYNHTSHARFVHQDVLAPDHFVNHIEKVKK